MKLVGENSSYLIRTSSCIGFAAKMQASSCDRTTSSALDDPIIPVVVKAEIKSLALQRGWGEQRHEALDALLRELPVADISADAVIQAYARLDYESRQLGRRMGKNDLWIAAVALVQDATVVTTDQDFDHLTPALVKVERIHLASAVKPST